MKTLTAAMVASLALIGAPALAQPVDAGLRADPQASANASTEAWRESDDHVRTSLERAMKRLDERLARMDQRLKGEEKDRRSRIDALMTRAENHARAAAAAAVKEELRPEKIQALNERAMAQARAGEAAAQAAEQALRELQPRLKDLSRRLDHLDELPGGEVPPS